MMMGLRTLPPAGGAIPFRVVLGALGDSFRRAETAAPNLCRQLAERTGLRHWVLTNSGRSALSISLKMMRELHPDRDEVVIPAYTSYSVPAAVVRAGLRVQLCDVELETFGMAPKALEQTFTDKTLCIVPHHLYGMPCQIAAISAIARDHGIPLVEDAAQAMGGSYLGQPLGSFGEVSIFSLSRGKTLPAAGGGLIGTNDDRIAYQCRQILRNQASLREQGPSFGIGSALEAGLMGLFIRPWLYWMPASLPFLKLGTSIYDPGFAIGPMSQFQERLASKLLPGVDRLVAIRQRNAIRLRRALSELQGLYIIWPAIEGEKNGCLRLPILVKDPEVRNRVLRELRQEGLGATDGYPAPLSDIPELRSKLASPSKDFPVARQVSRQLVTLPTHPHVTQADMERMVEVFRRCTQNRL